MITSKLAPSSETGLNWHVGEILDPEKIFDPAFYLETYPEVAAAGIDAWAHFVNHGDEEGRSAFAGFDAAWYASRVRFDNGTKGAFFHYCSIGNKLAVAPNPYLHEMWLERIKPDFDPDYYLALYEDVREAGVEPWFHFISYGAHEGRSPSKEFQTQHYLTAYLAPELANPQDAFLANALLHFHLLGLDKGYSPKAVQVQTPTETSFKKEESTTSTPKADHYLSLAAFLQKSPSGGSFENQATTGLEFTEILARSEWFNTEYYRTTTGLELSRAELIDHYLSEGEANGLSASAEFSPTFYFSLYSQIPQSIQHLRIAEGVPSLVHFLIHGRPAGLYPNAQIANLEIETIRASGSFNAEFYFRQLKRKPVLKDLVADYAIYGRLEGYDPNANVSGYFIRSLYAGGLGIQFHDPLVFLIENKQKIWVYGSQYELTAEARAVSDCPDFDPSFYARENDLVGSGIDPAEHFAVVGLRAGLPASETFDTEYYYETYPDISKSRINPLLHFYRNGRAEGRSGVGTTKEHTVSSMVRASDNSRQTIILYTHEFSLTGAPIVALNVAKKLSETCNVIVWGGQHNGPLFKDFCDVATSVYTGWSSTSKMMSTLLQIQMQSPDIVAIVNSVVCAPVVPALLMSDIPRITLIHEFANYVYPTGTLSRMKMFSDVSVFPATIVQEACEQELSSIGAVFKPESMRIRPQGYNNSQPTTANYTADQVAHAIQLDRMSPKSRVLFGAGQVQPRKGVDLFLQTARELLNRGEYDWKFIWVGGGYSPEKDMITSIYLQHQIRKSGLSEHLYMFDEQPNLEPFWEVSDIFFLSSRMDPFPNVALDAMERKLPVVCFEGGTGIASLEERFPFAVRSVPFMDTHAAAMAIQELASSLEAIDEKFNGNEGEQLSVALSFDAYVADLIDMIEPAKIHHAAIKGLEVQFESAPISLIDNTLQRVPLGFKLLPTMSEAMKRRNFATLMVDEHLDTGMVVSQRDGILQQEKAAGDLLRAVYGSVQSVPPSKNNLLHIHVEDATGFLNLLDPMNWAGRWLASADVVVTASDRTTLARIKGNLPNRMKTIDNVFLDCAHAWETIVTTDDYHARTETEHLMVSHCNVRAGEYRTPVGREMLDCLSTLMCGATVACMADQSDVVAVVPRTILRDDSVNVRRAFQSLTATSLPRTHAPRFTGTFRRKTLREFFETNPLAMIRPLDLNANERLALLSLMFTSFCLKSSNARMVQSQFLYG